MNKDRLEEYIKAAREEFDEIEQPNLEMVWQGVKKETSSPNHNRRWYVLALIGIAILGGLCYNYYQTSQKLTRLENFVLNSSEFKTEHQRLVKNVSDREAQIKELNIDQSEYEELFSELKELDENQLLLEEDFISHGDNREVMKTLFKQYERKTKILEILLSEIEKKHNNGSHQRHEM